MAFFTWLQDTPFAHWVASDPSLLAYPTILPLHTVGMAIVVGTCVVMDLRLLGIATDVPLAALTGAPRLVWTGFTINAATGIALFTSDAEHRATQSVGRRHARHRRHRLQRRDVARVAGLLP